MSSLTIASAPAGFVCTVSTNTPGQIQLIVQLPAPPVFGGINLAGGNLVFSGTGGVSNATFYLLGSTNLDTPLTNWTRLLTNQFDGSGNFNITNVLDTNAPQDFYLLEAP